MASSILVCVLIFSAPSTRADFQPALIGDSPYALPNVIDVPKETPDGNHFIRCECRLKASGAVSKSLCYPITASTSVELAQAVNLAVRKAKFQPAYEDGNPIRIFMQSIVLVEVKDSAAKVAAFPNDGINAHIYGWDYISPHRINMRTDADKWLWWRARIDKNGMLIDSQIDDAGSAGNSSINALKRTVKTLEFRPGFYDGEPVEMDYIEAVYNR